MNWYLCSLIQIRELKVELNQGIKLSTQKFKGGVANDKPKSDLSKNYTLCIIGI